MVAVTSGSLTPSATNKSSSLSNKILAGFPKDSIFGFAYSIAYEILFNLVTVKSLAVL